MIALLESGGHAAHSFALSKERYSLCPRRPFLALLSFPSVIFQPAINGLTGFNVRTPEDVDV